MEKQFSLDRGASKSNSLSVFGSRIAASSRRVASLLAVPRGAWLFLLAGALLAPPPARAGNPAALTYKEDMAVDDRVHREARQRAKENYSADVKFADSMKDKDARKAAVLEAKKDLEAGNKAAEERLKYDRKLAKENYDLTKRSGNLFVIKSNRASAPTSNCDIYMTDEWGESSAPARVLRFYYPDRLPLIFIRGYSGTSTLELRDGYHRLICLMNENRELHPTSLYTSDLMSANWIQANLKPGMYVIVLKIDGVAVDKTRFELNFGPAPGGPRSRRSGSTSGFFAPAASEGNGSLPPPSPSLNTDKNDDAWRRAQDAEKEWQEKQRKWREADDAARRLAQEQERKNQATRDQMINEQRRAPLFGPKH